MSLMRLYGLDTALAELAAPVFGTCAGMIVLDRNHLGLVDVSVRRNAFGRQVASFETDLDVTGIDSPVRAVFIRAPWVEEVGPGVEVLAEVDGRPVLAREGRFLVAAFHPELTDDTRLHEQFLDLVREEQGVRARQVVVDQAQEGRRRREPRQALLEALPRDHRRGEGGGGDPTNNLS